MNRSLRLLLATDSSLRIVGLAAFTIFIGAIYRDTNRASSVGLIGIATALPSLIALGFVNKLTYRISTPRLLRAVIGFRIVSLAGFALFPRGPILMMIAAGVQSLSYQFAISTKMTLDAEFVDESTRRTYLARKGMFNNIAIVCAPAAGGALVTYVGYGSALFALSALSVLTLIFLGLIPTVGLDEAHEPGDGLGFSASLRKLVSIKHVTAVVGLYCAMAVLLGMQAPLIFPFVHEVYAAGPGLAGILLGVAGLGGLVGAAAAERWPRLFSLSAIPSLVVLDGVLFLVFLQLTDLRTASLLFATLGAMGSITLILVEGVVQTEVEASNRPFVFSVMQFAGGAGAASLGVAAAFLAEDFTTKIVLSCAALVEIGTGVVCITFLRNVLRNTSPSSRAEH